MEMDKTNQRLVVALAFLLIVALAFSSLGRGMMGGPWLIGRGYELTGGLFWSLRMWLVGLAVVVFWAALILGVLVLVRMLREQPATRVPESPLDILKRRYALGEITREQFEQMRQDLEK